MAATKKKTAPKTAAKKTALPKGKMVSCWEDDPGDPKQQPALTPITVPAPNQAAKPYPFKITGATPAPATYAPGTPGFRFYANAAALRRTADFWGQVVAAGTKWEVGVTLPVHLDDGVDLNAFYTRGDFQEKPGLHFFHDSVGGRTYFSGESPDVCCHEMGHAVLDSIRPQLFDAQTIEAAAFHESFGDMSAMLSALQVPSFRQEVLKETGGTLNRASRLSRLAEQLGAAIRIQHPDDVEPDCLRNAVNSFFYRDPQTLPPSAPASALSSEPHSFSRVFTAAFLDALAGIVKLQSKTPTADDLEQASQDAARLLVGGVLTAAVVPDFYSQVAAHMIATSQTAPFNGKYKDVLKSAFVRRGVLSLQAVASMASIKVQNVQKAAMVHRAAMTSAPARASASLPTASISAAAYGLSKAALTVHTAAEPRRLAVTSAALTTGSLDAHSAQSAAESFTDDLFQRGRVEVGAHAHPDAGPVHPMGFRTHFIVEQKGELLIKRRCFDCGFH
jgi:hypothetical protein